jgi:hypothetical protein
MTTPAVIVYENGWSDHYVRICSLCSRPGSQGSTCDNGLHEPREAIEMVPSTAVAMAYRTYQRAELDPEADSGATLDEIASGAVEPTPAELVRRAGHLGQPLHFFFIDHGAR